MKTFRRRIATCAALALTAAFGGLAGPAQAQYPDRTIRIVVPYPPGGGADLTARLIAPHLAEALGKPVVIETKPGAGGNIGTELVARSAPDGYTLVLSSTATAVNQSMYRKLPFDVLRDFESVSVLATVPLIVAVNPGVEARSIKELIALARAQPGKLNYSSGGVGTANHLGGELFNMLAGVDIAHVPYKGGGPALNDLLAGHVQLQFGTVGSMIELVQAGRLRALASTGPVRTQAAPNLPTVIEAGVPGYDITAWYGLLAPAGTPRPVVERLAQEIDRVLKLPDVRDTLVKRGSDAVGGTPDDAARFLRNEVAKWEKVVARARLYTD